MPDDDFGLALLPPLLSLGASSSTCSAPALLQEPYYLCKFDPCLKGEDLQITKVMQGLQKRFNVQLGGTLTEKLVPLQGWIQCV